MLRDKQKERKNPTTMKTTQDPDTKQDIPEHVGESQQNRVFRDVVTTFFKLGPDPGEVRVIEGTLTEKGSHIFTRGNATTEVGRYKLHLDDGQDVSFLGSVVIDDLLAQIETGTYIRLTYDKNVKTGQGQNLKQFKLEIAAN